MSPVTLLLAFCLFSLSACSSPRVLVAQPSSTDIPFQAVVDCRPISSDTYVDQTWGGTRIKFSAIESPSAIYIGYYDAERWLAVSEIDKCTGKVNKVRLPSRFDGWDSHNYITLALDDRHRLHVAGNMHGSPLTYARMERSGDLGSMKTLRSMSGGDEQRTTYPNFFRFADGALGFSYRSGGSGDGKEILNRFDGHQWRRWLDSPLFDSLPGAPSISAYSTGYISGPDGYFHIAWVWRDTPAVETNFHVNYARSKDLRHWEDSNGKTIALPITLGNAEVVDPVGQMRGLYNNIKLGFDSERRPVISYIKFDQQGLTPMPLS
jgi:hypothetical protein